MAIPKFQSFLYPFLVLLRDKDAKKGDIKAALIKQFNLSEEDCKQKTRSGNCYVIDSHLGWVRQWLRRALFIEIPQRGVYRITPRGIEYLKTHSSLSEKDLLQYQEYYDYYYGGKGTNKSKKQKTTPVATPSQKGKKPEEGLVYILTNPAFKTYYIKIGFTTDLNTRLDDLYNTSVPRRFEVYAIMKTPKFKQAEKMLHAAFKASRIGDDREFFMLKPEEALEQMKIVAEGLDAKVIVYDENGKEKKVIDYSK